MIQSMDRPCVPDIWFDVFFRSQFLILRRVHGEGTVVPVCRLNDESVQALEVSDSFDKDIQHRHGRILAEELQPGCLRCREFPYGVLRD